MMDFVTVEKGKTMAEYLSLKAAIDVIMSEPTDAHYPSWYADKIESISVADVVPVRHGRWEWFEEWFPSTPDHPTECEDSGWRCSECKTALEDIVSGYWDDIDIEPMINYCPNCGAKMDEEKKENE